MVLFLKSKKNVSVFILFLTIGFSNSVSSQDQLTNKVMMGYQGWFLAPGDGSTTNNPWNHWFRSGTTPDPANLVVDMWPDMSEYTDKFNTNMTYADGSNAQLFSSYSLSTTRKHFEWMRDYNVQGIYLQRFLTAVQTQSSGMFSAKNKVLENVITSAVEYDRKYAVMYDVSGVTDAIMYAKIVADWEYLVDTYDILNKPEYVKQNGKPVVAIWGIGFKDRGLTSATSQAIIDYFKTNAALKYRAYVMGGVPEGWRTRSGASETGTDWTAVYNSLDMISPWSVGRYSNNSGADSFKTNNIVPDLAACNTINKDYMPVIWPGFSWRNLNDTKPLNQTPRNGGQFYWRQAYNAIQAGVEFIYVAMFDEVDEGTAMFKITYTKAKLPVEAKDRLVSLDIDGFNLPSDWYLKLADQTQKMLDGTISLTSVIPTSEVAITGLTSNGTTVITQGCVGSTLVIKGMNLTGATSVTVNGVAVASFVVTNNTTITATLPAGPIAAGAVVVSTPGGIATSTGNFAVNANVTPTFTQVVAICSGESLSALPTTSNNGIIGTWSPTLNNAATTEYIFTPSAGQCGTTATMTITVNPATTDGSVTQSQTSGSYFWPYNNVTYTSSTIVAIVAGCNTATLNLTINTGQPGTGATGGNLEGSDTSYTTWNGLAWSNGAPTALIEAIIDGAYSANGSFTAKKLTVNASKSITIISGTNVTVQNEVINNGSLVIENNANLIQINAVANTGAITVKRNSNALSRLDYTIWSSPVVGQDLLLFSPLTYTSPSRFYTYNETTNKYNAVASPSGTPFATAEGYLIRMPDNAPTTPTTTTFAGVFSGVPNNGPITKAMTYNGASNGYNLVGNPYPSTIDAQAFIAANTLNIESSLYFWRKKNGAAGSAYAIYNPLGETTATPSSALPNGTIQVGQGFFVKAKRASSVNFTNAMRVSNNDNQIFKTKQVQKDRVWLNLGRPASKIGTVDIPEAFSQALIGYTADATSGVDIYDAKYFNDSPVALTSSINEEEYTIQGRPAFDPTDVVALNFKTDAAGDYTIALDHFDGAFATGQDIYLLDSKTGAETDLKAGAYTFTAVAGVDNTRFSLKYQKILKVNALEFNENSVRVYKNTGRLFVNSGNVPISNIKVYDIQGRLIAEQKNLKVTTAVISNLKATHQVLIVKITSGENSLVTKKVVN